MQSSKKCLICNVSVWKWETNGIKTCNAIGKIETDRMVFIENGIISRIYPNDPGVLDFDEYNTIIDGQGSLILPGLIDSHIHVSMLGESQHYVNLDRCTSIEEVQVALANKHKEEPSLPYIIGFNWDQSKLGRLPHRDDIDHLVDKPVFLWRACWHISLANTSALALANLLTAPPSQVIPGGAIDYDAVTLLPTGILKERAVEPLVESLQQYSDANSSLQFLREGLRLCMKNGLTMVQSNDRGAYNLYTQRLQPEQLLPLRVLLTPVAEEIAPTISTTSSDTVSHASPVALSTMEAAGKVSMFQEETITVPADDQHDPDILETKLIITNAANPLTSRFGVQRVKIFSDGSLGAETAAIKLLSADTEADIAAEQTTETAYKGMLIHVEESLLGLFTLANDHGYRVEVHAIGDAAADQVITCLERLQQLTSSSSSSSSTVAALFRPILTHCQVLGAELIQRMSRLQMIANIQPSFVPTDMRWITSGNRISTQQLPYSYAWKTLLQQGIICAGGSDAPIEHPSPFLGIYDAIYRTNAKRLPSSSSNGSNSGSGSSSVFRPEECLTFSEALSLYTLGGAYAAGYEHYLGQIAEGFVADLIFVDPVILEDADKLYACQPYLTMIGGDVTYVNDEVKDGDSGRRPVIIKEDDSVVAQQARDFYNMKDVMKDGDKQDEEYQQTIQSVEDAPYLTGKGGSFAHSSYRRGYCPCTLHFQQIKFDDNGKDEDNSFVYCQPSSKVGNRVKKMK